MDKRTGVPAWIDGYLAIHANVLLAQLHPALWVVWHVLEVVTNNLWGVTQRRRHRPPEDGLLIIQGGHPFGIAAVKRQPIPASWYRSIMKLWYDHDDHAYDDFLMWEPSLQGETILFGSLARVREQMVRLREGSGCNYVIGAFAWGTVSHEQTRRSLHLFTEQVMPAFSESPAPVA